MLMEAKKPVAEAAPRPAPAVDVVRFNPYRR